jgi:hypothetical protein
VGFAWVVGDGDGTTEGVWAALGKFADAPLGDGEDVVSVIGEVQLTSGASMKREHRATQRFKFFV